MKTIWTDKYRRTAIVLALIALLSYVAISARMPQSFLVEDQQIDEASGLVASRVNKGVLYTHNDSGGESVVFAISSMGESLGRFVLDGIKNRDWEDIALGPGPIQSKSYLYVGEIGDNRAAYSSVFVYRFVEPEIPSDSNFVVSVSEIDRIEIVYEDGPRDAEALFIDPSNADIYIVSKREEKVGLYHVPFPQSQTEPNTAIRVADIQLSMVTAADITPDGRKILLKTYTGVWQVKVRRNQSVAKAVQGKLKALPYKIEPQGEAIAWDCLGKGYYTISERSQDNPLYLYYYR